MDSFTHSVKNHKQMIVLVSLLTLISCVVSSSYRGMAHDEGLGFAEIAVNIIEGKPTFDPEQHIGNYKEPTRLIYTSLIALAYKFCGVTLLALHVFPYLFQIINPVLFFWVLLRMNGDIWWSAAGATAFIFLPFNLTYLNQPHNHPVFMLILLCMALLLTYSVRPGVFWGMLGILSGLLILTRLEDGVIYVSAIYLACFITQRKQLHLGWMAISLGIILAMYMGAALIFQFPLSTYAQYIPAVLNRQEQRAGSSSWLQLTRSAIRILLNWYLLGKLLAPFLIAIVGIGTLSAIKKRTWYPLFLFFPHFTFLTIIYNGRETVNSLPVITFTTPGFIMLAITGIMSLSRILSRYITLSQWPWKLLCGMILIGVLGLWGRSIYSMALVVEDSQPASTIWNIIRANPRLPGHPDYQRPTVRLTQERDTSAVLPEHLLLRETLYKEVRGVFRPWALHRIGKYAFDLNLPEQARQHADIVFLSDYEFEQTWRQAIVSQEGSATLWNPKYSGRIGAFPRGTDGTIIYKWDTAQPINDVVISGIYTQWGIGDVMKMWTSTDGRIWTLRYGGWNARFVKDVYYQFFDQEFEGASSLYLKYYFRAGDKTRPVDDNRGASLENLGVTITYKR